VVPSFIWYLATRYYADFLSHFFHPLLTLPQVYNEMVTQGRDRPGAPELTAMCERGEVRLAEMTDPQLIEQVRQASSGPPPVSDVDVMVVALAVE
jgi:hypothetical protein